MIIWQGHGYLVAVIVLALGVAVALATESYFGDAGYYQTHGWPLAASLLLAGLACWSLGGYLHRRGARTVVDKATGQELVIGGKHTLFFVPMHWWGPILAVIAAIVLAVGGW